MSRGNGISFAEARALKAQESLIVRPEQARLKELEEFQQEWKELWTLRDGLLQAALSGGHAASIGTLDECEALAKETLRRRLTDCVALAKKTGAPMGVATLWVASQLGVDVSGAEKGTETPKVA